MPAWAENHAGIVLADPNSLLINGNFIKKEKYYETSILNESLENTKINKKELLKENIKNYKNKLLSSYWTEINLIGYKIELLEKQKFKYPKEELEGRIINIGTEICEVNERSKRHCFNCGSIQNKNWHALLKEHYLCHVCGTYKQSNNGTLRPNKFWNKSNKVYVYI
uniref:GATA-type domain-containing protein n=1 Tax=Meloidogyne enterolobii TaxID=390850 RepID=A0A6V7THQ7_MELEN|nr:unnamed protein product [Meloidogyne enterolobii]